jgi:hypothetical protein
MIPGNSFFILKVVMNVTFFSILQEENVQNFMKKYVFKQAEKLQEILLDQGPLVSGLIFMAVIIIVTAIGLKVPPARAFFIRQKEKMMWSSVLRA